MHSHLRAGHRHVGDTGRARVQRCGTGVPGMVGALTGLAKARVDMYSHLRARHKRVGDGSAIRSEAMCAAAPLWRTRPVGKG
eukprot:8618952-Alexandrium_andersonii.AAC.1